MRYSVPLVVFALCNLSVQSLPVPAGQIIHYNLPNKLFSKNSSIYEILSKIHYGGSTTSAPTEQNSEVTTTYSENVEVKNDETTKMTLMEMEVTSSDESQEAPVVTDDVTDEEQNHQQILEIDTTMKDNTADNDESLTALIEKVVNEQIEKLATEADTGIKGINLPSEQNKVIENNDLVDATNAMSNTEKSQLDDQNDDDRVIETTMAINSEKTIEKDEEEEKTATTTEAEAIPEMSNIESVDLDRESESTNVPTNQPEITTNMDAISIDTAAPDEQQQKQQTINENEKLSEEATNNKNEIPAPLLNAIGDLLSSVLGIRVSSSDISVETSTSDDSEDENIHTTTFATVIEDEVAEATTIENDNIMEQELSSSTSALEFNENNSPVEDETVAMDVQNNESDVVMPQESFHNVNANEIDLKIENLANVHHTNFMTENTPEVYTETIKEPSNDEILEALPTLDEEAAKPVSIQDSVNHIMSLVRGTEDKMALEKAHNIVDSVLIDHKAVNDNVNHILNTALKEIETNFGMNQNDKEIEIPTDALDTLDREREEMIRNFETDINESLIDSTFDDPDNFVPNVAKAALYHRFQYGDDF